MSGPEDGVDGLGIGVALLQGDKAAFQLGEKVDALLEELRPYRGQLFGRHERSLHEALDLVFQADLFIRYRPMAQQIESARTNAPWNVAKPFRISVGLIGNVAAEQFVGAFSG